jgi:pimeloyl-ACP methyl ester carboxylesterase
MIGEERIRFGVGSCREIRIHRWRRPRDQLLLPTNWPTSCTPSEGEAIDRPSYPGRVRVIPPPRPTIPRTWPSGKLAAIVADALADDRRKELAASQPRGRAWSQHGPVVSDISGEGPPLILLHGLAGSALWWRRNTPALERSFKVHAIDLPGFGASKREARFVLDDAPAQLIATMDRLGIERASIIGHSMGGLVAAGLAAHYPDRVDRLVLVDAGFLSLDPHFRHRITGPIGPYADLAVAVADAAWDSIRSGPIRLVEATSLLQADWRAKLSNPGTDPRRLGSTTGLPTASGARSWPSPGSRLVVIEGAAHNPMWERPDARPRGPRFPRAERGNDRSATCHRHGGLTGRPAGPERRPRIIPGMLLSLDVGNTNLSVGMSNVGEPSGFIGEGRIATSPRDIKADGLEALLARLLGLEDRPLEAIVQAIVMASVIPAWSAAAADLATRRGIPLLEASSKTVPIPVRIDRPADAGAVV